MVSVRTLGSHQLISLSEKNNSELVKWIMIWRPISKLQHLLLLCFRSLKVLIYIGKKENIGYKQGCFRTSATKASSSSMLHLFAFPIAVLSRTSICNSDKIPHGNS